MSKPKGRCQRRLAIYQIRQIYTNQSSNLHARGADSGFTHLQVAVNKGIIVDALIVNIAQYDAND